VGNFATFIDEQGSAYEINHRIKKAFFVERQEVTQLRKLHSPRTVLVNGKPGGMEYRHQPYGLIMRTEWGFDDSLTVRELYDVRVAEPDQSLFRIPEGYSIDPTQEQ
jgi:hypothetical protein